MKKKDFTFIFGLTLLMGIIWIVGEVVMGLWIPVVPVVHAIWLTAIVAVCVVISVWHAFKEDKSDPKISKYERKTQKSKQK